MPVILVSVGGRSAAVVAWVARPEPRLASPRRKKGGPPPPPSGGGAPPPPRGSAGAPRKRALPPEDSSPEVSSSSPAKGRPVSPVPSLGGSDIADVDLDFWDLDINNESTSSGIPPVCQLRITLS